MNDLRFAFRQLLKSPGFTILAVLTLAIGIGMNTAIFSLMNDLFLRGLPFKDPDHLVRVYNEAKERDLKRSVSFSVPKYWHYRDGQSVFTGLAADGGNGFIMTGMGQPVQLLGGNVTANYFDLLGIHPILGRNFLPEEETKGDVAMVTETFWRKRLNSDPAVLGPKCHPQRRGHNHHRGAARTADFMVRTRHGDFRKQAFRSPRAATIAARRSASSAAERRCMKRIAAPRRRRPGGRSPTPAIWPS